MTEKQKQLLMKDLCGRLPYGVIVKSRIIDFHTEESAHDHFPNHVKHPSYVGNGRLFLIDTLSNSVCIRPILKNLTYREQVFFEDICKNGYIPINECKPYLFPLSSMSTSERNEIAYILGCDFPWSISEGKLTWTVGGSVESELFELTIDQLEKLMHIFNSRHYDYRGLIEQGLAIDATGLGIYKEEEEL